jgi:hypothetical protein
MESLFLHHNLPDTLKLVGPLLLESFEIEGASKSLFVGVFG